MAITYKPIRFTSVESNQAFDDWKFNCGPGALCAILNMTPDELRPHFGDFEKKGFIGPTAMYEILKRMNIDHLQTFRSDDPRRGFPRIQYGLARVQFGGPWTNPGVPMAARYWHTHWVAIRSVGADLNVFDINAIEYGGWLEYKEWATSLVPWLIKECSPKSDGTWWATHGIEIKGNHDNG